MWRQWDPRALRMGMQTVQLLGKQGAGWHWGWEERQVGNRRKSIEVNFQVVQMFVTK